MLQFSLVYNNLFVFLEPVDEPRPTYDCGQLMQGGSIPVCRAMATKSRMEAGRKSQEIGGGGGFSRKGFMISGCSICCQQIKNGYYAVNNVYISLIGVPSAHVRQPCLQLRLWKNNGHVRTRIVTNYPVKTYKKIIIP